MQAPQDGTGFPTVVPVNTSAPSGSSSVTSTIRPHVLPPHTAANSPADTFTNVQSQQHRPLFTAEIPPVSRATDGLPNILPTTLHQQPLPPSALQQSSSTHSMSSITPMSAHGLPAQQSHITALQPSFPSPAPASGFMVSQAHNVPSSVSLPQHIAAALPTVHRPISQPGPQQIPVVHMPSGALPPQPAPPTTAPASGQQQAQQFQRLKVEDALSYLDQVKLQFGNHPQVYNDFLDIMKEFKSQTIDTPGVISRVSNLFKGHPDLIVGFNTFLPPGYKIEVQANDTISVQQPGQPSITLSQLAGQNQAPAQYKPVNLSVNPTHQDSMRNIDTMVAAAGGSTPSSASGQPVEFNHAINYVNKIKNRFQGQPDIYKNFLEILHKYQKEQRQLKDGIPQAYKPLSETEVYSQVAKLFQNQEDLLKEFGQFLPDANGGPLNWGGGGKSSGLDLLFRSEPSYARVDGHTSVKTKPPYLSSASKVTSSRANSATPLRKTAGSSTVLPKKSKISGSGFKDVSLAEAGKYGSLSDYAYFDKVRKALRSQEVYENFLRCLVLFNQEVITKAELVQLIQPFLGKYPELFRRFKDFLGYKDSGSVIESVASAVLGGTKASDRMTGRDDLSMEIDYSSCKRYGHSYRGLPKSYHPPRCTGRTQLCKEVLNDTWVSFPSWSEESTFVTSRKTQFEENIYRCEDERFELDMVIEMNLATVRVLEGVQKKLQRMSSDEAAKFKLDNSLGGSSDIIHRKAIQRIYGDKSSDIIDGLKRNPVVAVPLVLRRLKAKDDEWREAQRQFNKIWREQNDKYYLKSLDHQGISFKQNDVKALRSKSLLNEIEAIYDTEQKCKKEAQECAADESGLVAPASSDAERTPHLAYTYKQACLVDDAMGLIIHHVRRQASIQKEDKQKIKALMKHNVQNLFHRQSYALSDQEEDDDDDMSGDERDSRSPKPAASDKSVAKLRSSSNDKMDITEDTDRTTADDEDDEMNGDGDVENGTKYSLFFANNNWYLFLRLHHILCTRLLRVKGECDRMTDEHSKCKENKADSTAVALRLKSSNELTPDQYYCTFLELIKSLLDGNIECGYYEDQLREMFGIHAYIAFTLDKVVQNIVKQLQYAVSDDLCREVTDLWIKAAKTKSTGGVMGSQAERLAREQTYQKSVEHLLADENCFKISVVEDCELSTYITLLDSDQDSSLSVSNHMTSQVTAVDKWSEYVDKFVTGGVSDSDMSDDVKEHLKKTPVFMSRNLKIWKRRNHKLLAKPSSEVTATVSSGLEVTAADVEDDDKAEPREPEDDEVAAVTSDLDILEGQACRFNLDSFKMVYVVNSNSYLYKRLALTRARQTHPQVSAAMTSRWEHFCKNWRDENATVTEMMRVQDWMEGRDLEDCKPCHTTCHRDNDINLIPYHPYRRFTVRYEKVTATTVSAVPDDGTLTALSADDAMDITA